MRFFGLSEIVRGTLTLGRVSAAPPMSCLLGILCQATLEGTHSVANMDMTRSTSAAPQSGHGGASVAKAETSSSKRSPQPRHRYS